MKHEVLPKHWSIKKCQLAFNYLINVNPESRFAMNDNDFIGMRNGVIEVGFNPFGQLLTEEQFLYCIGEPAEGEEIEVSNAGFEETSPSNAYLLKIDTNSGAWVVKEVDDNTAKWWVDYRRKHLVFKVDKWAKEKAAFAEGKTIQCFENRTNTWFDVLDPSWVGFQYRIKPKPKYAPFTREDWDLFKMKEVRNSPCDGVICIIISCDNDGVRCGGVLCTYKEAFYSIVFADGTPFGKLIEE